MNIIDAITDDNLFRPYLGMSGDSWVNWFAALRVLYGLPLPPQGHAVVEECTGRNPAGMPAEGFETALFLTGRRSGKSRMAALVAAYEAALVGRESRLAPGERGVVALCAPTLRQGRVVKDYVRAVFEAPLLKAELAGETREGFELASGTRIEILAGDFRTIRGFTLLAAIVDEACFFGCDAECRIKSDTELVRAIQPSLATVGGKLVCISSPYAKRGWCYSQHRRNFGNQDGRVLVWNCPSRTMNPSLPQRVVDAALEEDRAAAASEYLGQFRDDVAEFLSRTVIEGLVVPGRRELLPVERRDYVAFADLSGGRADDAALAIAHRQGQMVVLDCIRRYAPPFNPHAVCRAMAEVCRKYGVQHIVGDNYAAEFVAHAFASAGMIYERCEKPKAVLYAEMLPRMCSQEIELLDDPTLVDQLAGLERRTRSGGRDVIDHPVGGHDDVANAVSGAAMVAAIPRTYVGALR